VGNVFEQLDGPIHAVDLATTGFDAARLSALGAIHVGDMSDGNIVISGGLDHTAELLPDLVSGDLDVVVVRRPGALLLSLDFRCHLSSLLQQIGKFFIQKCLLRVHANLPEG
jgi:hypothetical protein